LTGAAYSGSSRSTPETGNRR